MISNFICFLDFVLSSWIWGYSCGLKLILRIHSSRYFEFQTHNTTLNQLIRAHSCKHIPISFKIFAYSFFSIKFWMKWNVLRNTNFCIWIYILSLCTFLLIKNESEFIENAFYCKCHSHSYSILRLCISNMDSICKPRSISILFSKNVSISLNLEELFSDILNDKYFLIVILCFFYVLQ